MIGGGPIGMEMAQAHRRLGCAVTVIEGARALGREDPETAAVVLDALAGRRDGDARGPAGGAACGHGGAVEVDAGRRAAGHGQASAGGGRAQAGAGGLNLAAAGVDFTPKGVTVDAAVCGRTNRRVYAVGDAAGGLQFTHVAGYHAGVVIRQVGARPAREGRDACISRG